jgi:hypothetical protein
MAIMIPVHSRRTFIVELQTPMSYSLCFSDTCNIRDLIVDIIPSSISLPILAFTRFVVFHPRDLFTCCNIAYVISLSESRVSFRHVKEQILLLVHTPQSISLAYPKTPFQSPFYGMTVDAIKAATGYSD